MPGLSGLETAQVIPAEDPTQSIVVFTASVGADLVDRATRLGVVVDKANVSALYMYLRDEVRRHDRSGGR